MKNYMKQIFIYATFTNFLEAEDSNDYENFFFYTDINIEKVRSQQQHNVPTWESMLSLQWKQC